MNEDVKFIIEITVPHFGSLLTAKYIDSLGYGCKRVETKNVDLRTPVVLVYESTAKSAADALTKSLIERFKESYLTFTVKAVARWKDDWEKFEHLLRTHDHSYMMSDDHRAWSAGEYNWRRIIDLRDVLIKKDSKRVLRLWKRYGFDKPLVS